jgi:hypothetical protein
MCHHTTIHKAAHLSPIGLIGPVRTGPYFLALANILHPSAVGARGCSGHQLLKTQKRSKFLLSNFLKSYFHEDRAESRYDGPLFSPSSLRPLLLSQSSYCCPLGRGLIH